MGIDLRKQSHVFFFVVFLPLISLGLGWVSARLFPDAPFWVETLSPLAAYGLLFGFFDKVAWHWPLFRWLGVVTVPDVRGRWLGEQISSVKKDNGKHIKSRVILEIAQTFSQIHAETYYQRWHSTISVAQFVQIQEVPTLLIMFDAEPKTAYEDTHAAHKGVTKLCQRADGQLEGTYFNGAGQHGDLTFRRTRYTLHRTFDSIATPEST